MNKVSGILLLLIYVFLVSALLNDNFVGAFNQQNNARWTAMFAIIGIGVAFVIITGGIDLSIGSLIGLVGCLLPMFTLGMAEHEPSATLVVTLRWIGIESVVLGAGWIVALAFMENARQGLLSIVLPIGHWIYFAWQRWDRCRFPVILLTTGVVLLSVSGFAGHVAISRWASWGVILAWIMAIAMHLGLAHGLLVTKLNLQPFVVTLCGLLIYRGMARSITADKTKGFGTDYDETLRLISTGKPCSVAFIFLVIGIVMAVWFTWKLFRALNEAQRKSNRGLLAVGVAVGLVLAVAGSARFWHGWELVEVSTFVPAGEERPMVYKVLESGAIMPGRVMFAVGWVFVPAAIWFVVLGLRSNFEATIKPLVSVALGGAFMYGAMWIKWQSDDWFWPAASYSMYWRLAAMLAALEFFIMSIIMLTRIVLREAGSSARWPLALASSFALMCFVGWCYLCSADIARAAQERVEGFAVPAPLFVMFGVAILTTIFLNWTIYGRYLLALGRNPEAAQFSGINTDRMVITAYVVCSAMAGLGGILFALDGNSIQPSGHGSFYELFAIAAAVLGGCSLRGGEGTILGVVIGAAVLPVLRNSVSLLGLRSRWEFAILGFVILITVIVDEVARRIAAKQRALHEAALAEASADKA